MKKVLLTLFVIFCASTFLSAQSITDLMNKIDKLQRTIDDQQHTNDILKKKIDDVLWFEKVGDVAFVDKIFMTGPARWKELNPTSQSAGNPVKVWSYVFVPKDANASKKHPLMVLVHGGIHGDFDTYFTHIVRELISQGYVVLATEYRGSTGYGKSHWQNIDYGGLENQDVREAKERVLENYSTIVDKNNVGIMGWSHGGMITLMNLFEYPTEYKCGFAGVPVSDVVARLGYKGDSYEDLFSASYHVGKTVNDNIKEYRRRSPVFYADKLKSPLLIHTNTTDEDVNVYEVQHMINALKAENKKFEYRIYDAVPGGHSFDRMDHKQGIEIRYEIYKFLDRYMKPPKPFKSVNDMKKAAYRFY